MIASGKFVGPALLIVLAVGCNNSKTKTPSTSKESLMVVEPGKPASPTATLGSNVPAAGTQPANETAGAFLKALTAGDFAAARELVSVSFRKEVSGPLTFEEEKKLGYSDSDTEKYLKSAAAGTRAEIKTQVVAPGGNAVAFRGEFTGGPEPRSFRLRVAKEGDTWKVTRFASCNLTASGTPKDPGGNPELLWARQTALDFLASLVGGDGEQLLTIPMLTDEFKASLPSPSIADPGLNYARKDVRNWLNKVHADSTGFVIDREELPKGGAVFTGHLSGGMNQIPFQLELTRDGERWVVSNFELKP